MARNWIVAGTAWTGIVALAWWLADARVKWCPIDGGGRFYCGGDEGLGQLTTRDNVLIWGGSIPLALFVLLTIAGRARIGRLNLRWPRRQPSISRDVSPRSPR